MNSIRKNLIYNLAYQILAIIIPLLTTPYISRVLGANGIGIYSYSYSVAQYFVLFIMLGLNNYGNRAIAEVKDDRESVSRCFWSIYAMQFRLGIFISLIYFFYCYMVASNTKASFIMGIYVISACFDINWFFFGLEKFKITTLRNMFIKILTTIFLFAFVKTKSDVYIYCIIMVIGIISSQAVLWLHIRQLVDFYRPTFNDIKIHIKPNLLLFLTVIAVSIFKIMSKIMLGILTDTKQVGFYELSERIISIPLVFVTSLGTVMLPRMTNMVAKKDKGSELVLYKSILVAMFFSTLMSFGIMGVSKVFVPLFYGPGYEICIYLFLTLLPSCLFLAFGNVIRTQYLLPNQMDKVYVISAFLGAGVNILINFIFIPRYGAIGAAIGTFFAEGVVCVYQSYMIKKYIDIKVYVIRSMPFIVSGIAMFLILFNLNLKMENQIVMLFIEILIGAIIYFAILLIQWLTSKYIFKKDLF